MRPEHVVYVVGHQRPDTDSAVSAVMAARLLELTRPGSAYIPLLQGPALPQTQWLFERAGQSLPAIRMDIRPTAAEACVPAEAVPADSPLGRALDLIHERGYSLVPVVDSGGKLLGGIGHSLPVARYLSHFNLEDFFGTLVGGAELARGLGLGCLNEAARRLLADASCGSPPVPGVFRLFVGGQPCGPGDALLAGGADLCSAILRQAEEANAALVIFADCKVSAMRQSAESARVPAFHFPGSLMALVTQLPRAIPASRVMTADVPTAKSGECLEDLRHVFIQTPHALPVVDGEGRLLGMISRREALAPPRPGLVLVDHFEKSQTVRGWEQAEILEIIDHHRVGAIETPHPARVDCRPVGSTATILARRFEEAGIPLEPSGALLLLGAMVADTLLFRSPTTSAEDKRLGPILAERAGVELEAFGREVLVRNDGLAHLPARKLVTQDLKEFFHGRLRFLLGQIETVNLGLLTPQRAAEILEALEAERSQAGAAFALVMITDVFQGASRILVADPLARRARHILEGEPGALGVLRGIVSRKKELLPRVLARLESFHE